MKLDGYTQQAHGFLFSYYVNKEIIWTSAWNHKHCILLAYTLLRYEHNEYLELANEINFFPILNMAQFEINVYGNINSIVVDDVDGDCDNNGGTNSHYYSDSHHHHQFYIQHQTSSDGQENNEVFDDNADARSDISQCSRGSRGSTSREESETRLQQIKASLAARFSFLVLIRKRNDFPNRPPSPQGLLSIAQRYSIRWEWMFAVNRSEKKERTSSKTLLMRSGQSLFAQMAKQELLHFFDCYFRVLNFTFH